MKNPNANYIKDDINGQFGAQEHSITIDGKTYEIDLQNRNFSEMFDKVILKGRLVSE